MEKLKSPTSIEEICMETINGEIRIGLCEECIPPEFQKSFLFVSMMVDGVGYVIDHDNLSYHIDEFCKPLYEERYDSVSHFIENAAQARLNGLWFHIGRDGKPLYEERYDNVTSFDNYDIAEAHLGTNWFHIGRDGKPLYSQKFYHVDYYDEALTSTVVKINSYGRHDDTRIYMDGNEVTVGSSYVYDGVVTSECIEIIPQIGSRLDDLYVMKVNGNITFCTGCFCGGIEDFEHKINDTHYYEGCREQHKYYLDYMAVVDRYKNMT